MLNPLLAHSEYITGREALLVQIDMSAYLIDYYLHRKEVAPETTSEQDGKLKDMLACLAIHLAVRTAIQTHAWTLHTISEPPFSLFATGSVSTIKEDGFVDGYLVGNVLTEHIRHTDVNSLHAQFTNSEGKSSKSYVQSENSSVAEIVEHFYRQSEQQPLRIHLSRTSDSAIGLAALPEYDQEWFEKIDLSEIIVDTTLTRKPMRTGRLVFACDCSPQRLIPFFRSIPVESVDELYGQDDQIVIACPRCGRNFPISKSELGRK